MSSPSRVTARRLSYASGYLGLNLIKEAARELEAVAKEDRSTAAFLMVQSEYLLATKQWERLASVSEELILHQSAEPTGWINWAYALRELEQVVEAKVVLFRAEALHPDVEVLHYNLACYHCLLGEMKEAKRRLQKACKLNPSWKETAASIRIFAGCGSVELLRRDHAPDLRERRSKPERRSASRPES